MLSARRLVAYLGAAAVLATSACGGVTSPSKNRTEDFSGTLEVGGQNTHTFNTNKNGEYEVRITALAPSSNAFIGVIVGRQAGGSCFPEANNPFAQLSRLALSGPIFSGGYCVSVYDPGSLSQSQNYTIQVSYP